MKGLLKMIKFHCRGCLNDRVKTWTGYISKLVYSGSHMELSIHMVEPIAAVVCKTLSGFFVYFAHYETGLNLSSLFDVDENIGRLMTVFVDKDAVTVAYAINKVGNLLSTPRRRRRSAIPSADGLQF